MGHPQRGLSRIFVRNIPLESKQIVEHVITCRTMSTKVSVFAALPVVLGFY